MGDAGLGDIRDDLAYQGRLLDTSCIKVSTAVFGGTESGHWVWSQLCHWLTEGPHFKDNETKFRDKSDFIRDTQLDWQGQY